MKLCIDTIPAAILAEVLGWYGVDVPPGTDDAGIVRSWNLAVARRRGSS